MRVSFFFLLLFSLVGCEPDWIEFGDKDARALSLQLVSSKSVYEYGEEIYVQARVSTPLSTIHLYHWFTDEDYETFMTGPEYRWTPNAIHEEPYPVNISATVRVGTYTATADITVTVNPPTLPPFEFFINDEPAQTQLLPQMAQLTAEVIPQTETPLTCFWYWDSQQLNTESQLECNYQLKEDDLGTHHLSVKVNDGVKEVIKSCIVKVGSMTVVAVANDGTSISTLYGKDLELKALLRYPETHQLTSLSWLILNHSSQWEELRNFTSEELSQATTDFSWTLSGNSSWLKPNPSKMGKDYLLKVRAYFKDGEQKEISEEDTISLNVKPYTPLKEIELICPRSISFFDLRNGKAKASVNVEGGRESLSYEWYFQGSQLAETQEPYFTFPDLTKEVSDSFEGDFRVIVSDGLSQLTKEVAVRVEKSDAPLIHRYHTGEVIDFNSYQSTAENVYVVVSRVEEIFQNSESEVATSRGVVAQRGIDLIGARKNFNLNQADGVRQVAATLRRKYNASGRNLEIWVDNECWRQKVITEDDIQTLSEAFLPSSGEGIYHHVTKLLGEEWGVLPSVISRYISPQGTISILLCDIDEDKKTEVGSGATIGVFEPEDCLSKLYSSQSDEKLLLTLDSYFFKYKRKLSLLTLAHEFSHLTTFFQKEVCHFSGKRKMSTWLNEMIALCVEDVVGEILEIEGPRGYCGTGLPQSPISKGRFPFFVTYPGNTLTPSYFYSEKMGLYNYATAAAFGSYLIRNYGHEKLLKNILNNSDDGLAAVVNGLHKSGFSVDLQDLFADWGTAVVLSSLENLPETSRLRYNGGENGVRVAQERVLGSIDFHLYQHNGTAGVVFSSKKPNLQTIPSQQNSHIFYHGKNQYNNFTLNGKVPDQCTVTIIEM